MTKIIAVTGGTGAQGGGIVNIMLKTPGWKVRIITRNAENEKAKALAERGAEVVTANFDDESSLVKAFEGAHAVFAVTNFWEHLFRGKSQSESGELETQQALALARAANKTASLEHYIWSTLPNANKLTGGKHPVPHFDYKAEVDERIRKELPDLAAKTTYLMLGYYTQNVTMLPHVKPFELAGSGKWVQIVPTPSSATIPVTGDMNVGPGVFVRQILAHPAKSHAKYVVVSLETLSFGQMAEKYAQVTGRPTAYLQADKKDWTNIWGISGKELVDQLEFGEVVQDWVQGLPVATPEQLEIRADEVPDYKATIGLFKDVL